MGDADFASLPEIHFMVANCLWRWWWIWLLPGVGFDITEAGGGGLIDNFARLITNKDPAGLTFAIHILPGTWPCISLQMWEEDGLDADV